jgi:hypothetical protein
MVCVLIHWLLREGRPHLRAGLWPWADHIAPPGLGGGCPVSSPADIGMELTVGAGLLCVLR